MRKTAMQQMKDLISKDDRFVNTNIIELCNQLMDVERYDLKLAYIAGVNDEKSGNDILPDSYYIKTFQK